MSIKISIKEFIIKQIIQFNKYCYSNIILHEGGVAFHPKPYKIHLLQKLEK